MIKSQEPTLLEMQHACHDKSSTTVQGPRQAGLLPTKIQQSQCGVNCTWILQAMLTATFTKGLT